MPSKYRITTNGRDFRVEERQVTGLWKNRFSYHFPTKDEASAKIRKLEEHDAERKHQWIVVED